MRVCVTLVAALGLTTPALAAQTAPVAAPANATATTAAPAAPAKPQMVKKVVCERVDVEETTGSRLGSAPKKCRTIEVPATGGGSNKRAPRPERGAN